jgi:hypothetical protein
MPGGRPRLTIDWAEVIEYARAHASGASIARILGISNLTLMRAIEREFNMTYTEFMEAHKQEGKAIVKRVIYDAVLGGNAILAIWWTKNCLGWSDKASIQHEGLAPVLQININEADAKEVKQIEDIFNGKVLDSRISKELGSISEGIEADRE